MPNTLENIIAQVLDHPIAHPYNCPCMDKHIRNLEQLLTALDFNSRIRLSYILRTAGKEY